MGLVPIHTPGFTFKKQVVEQENDGPGYLSKFIQLVVGTGSRRAQVFVVTAGSDASERYEVNADALEFSFLDASWTPAAWLQVDGLMG